MPDRTCHFFETRGAQRAIANLALSLFMISPDIAWPQSSPPLSPGLQSPAEQDQPNPPGVQPAEPGQSPAQKETPGLINEMGKLFEKSLSILPTLKSPGETIDDLNTRARDAAKEAGDSLSRLAQPSSIVTGRVPCSVAANGAPDCKAGADKLCQSRGYKEGKSLDTDAAEKCSPKVFLPGRKREPGDCKTENHVTRALCQ